ncbi:MAG TPA: glycosyltransferase family 9 protein [Thermoanaerobaculia bacterium]|jgi:heptosyltransferase-2|nr:glycosyltransferase family 9 protein [Thermoanaerobaculia bacterium]
MSPADALRELRLAGQRAAAMGLETVVRLAARRLPAPAAPPAEPSSIFVLRNNDVGDLLVVTPLFAALRTRYPQARIAAGVGGWNLDVLRHNPHLSQVLTVDAPWLNKYARATALGRLRYLERDPQVERLAAERFAVGIDVAGTAWGSLLLLRAHIPYRLGVRGYAGGDSGAQATIPYAADEHVGRMALRFAELLGCEQLPEPRPQLFLTDEETREGESWWQAAPGAGSGARGARIVVAPGGGLPSKLWPAERFAALTGRLAASHLVTVLAGPAETALARAVAADSGALVSQAALRGAFALVAAADLVICNSSMAMHVAAAFGKPAVVLLGAAFPSAAAHQRQWGYPELTRSLGKEPGRDGELASVEAALAAADELLAGRAAA